MTAVNASPPKGLSVRARRLWRAVLADYELSPAEQELLRCACIALDRADAAASVVEREGLVVLDRYGTPKTHPGVEVELRSRALLARLVGQLGVRLVDGPQPARRPGQAKPGPKPRVARLREVG